MSDPLIKLRTYAEDPFWDDDTGIQFWLWRRQAGKSFTAACKALRRMMLVRGLSSFFVSASVALATEFIRKEAEVWQKVLAAYRLACEAAKQELHTYSVEKGKTLEFDADNIDDLTEVFEAQKLETRIYHTRTLYSRSRVIAPNPSTAVGWTGDIWLDEVSRMPELKDVLEAVLPFMSSNPQFRLLAITTPAPDDKHYSWELFAPRAGEEEFAPNKRGNYYTSQAGIRVHRVDAYDAQLAGVDLYDDTTRKVVTPAEHRASYYDKQSWDRNYALKWIKGGSAALSLTDIERAMRAPVVGAQLDITDTLSLGDVNEMFRGSLLDHVGSGPLVLAVDLGTTTNKTSNPTAIALVEQAGLENVVRLAARWKTDKPDVTKAILLRICQLLIGAGKALRAVSVDASNERFFASDVRAMLAGLVRVNLCVLGTKVQYRGQDMSLKSRACGRVEAAALDNRLRLPAAAWVSRDLRQMVKEAGLYNAEVEADGAHADFFIALALALDELDASGPAEAAAVSITGARPDRKPGDDDDDDDGLGGFGRTLGLGF